MKKLIVILVVFTALAGTGIYFVLPTNIDWDRHMRESAAAFQRRTGVSLVVSGKPAFSMKPSPVLRLGKIRLGNVADSTYPQMMTADGAEVLFDAASLFRRQIKIKKVTLRRPQFYFETLPNGKWNWQTAFFDRAGTDSAIGFASLLMTDGGAEVKSDKYSPVEKWDKLNAEMFADSLHGPFFLEGNVGAAASTFGFSLKVEKFAAGQSPDFSLRLINAPAEASFVLNGTYGLSATDGETLSGTLTYDVRKPDRFFALLYPNENLPAPLFQPIVGNLKLKKNAQTRTLSLSDILFKYGNSSASGKMSVRTLTAQEASERQAEEESFAPVDDEDEEIVLRDPDDPTKKYTLDGAPVSEMNLAEHLLPKVYDGSFVFSKFEADPFVDHLNAVLDFAVKNRLTDTNNSFSADVVFDTVDFRRDAVHQLKTKVSLTKKGMLFSELSGTFPGNAYFHGDAELKLDKTPMLTGKMAAEIDSANVFFGWAGVPLPDEIPQGLLRGFKASGDFTLARNGVLFKNVKGELDQNAFSGNLAVRSGKRPAVNLAGNIADLNVARYFPAQSKAFADKRGTFSGLSARDQVKSVFDGLAFLNGFDLNLRLTSPEFSWGDLNGTNLNADFSLARGVLKIKNLSADNLLASKIELSGTAEGFGGDPRAEALKVYVEAKQLSSLTQMFGVTLPRGLSPQDGAVFSVKVDGSMQAAKFESLFLYDQNMLSLNGTVNAIAPDQYDWNAKINTINRNFRTFVGFFTDSYRPAKSNPGLFQLSADLQKTKNAFRMTGAEIGIGRNSLKGDVKIETGADGKKKFSADLTAENLELSGVLPRMNFMDKVRSDSDPIPDVLTQNGFLSRFAENLSFSQKPFDLSFLGNYDAAVSIKANRLVLAPLELTGVDGVVTLNAGKIGLDLRRSLWNGANFGGMFSFVREQDGKVAASVAARLSNATAPVKIFGANKIDLANLEGLTVNVKANASGKSADEWAETLSGKGSVLFSGADVIGVNVGRLQAQLQGQQKSKEDLDRVFLAGKTDITRFKADLTVNGGVLTLRPASFVYGGETLNANMLTFNYRTGSFSANAQFPSGISGVDNVVVSIEKKTDAPVVVTTNSQYAIKSASEVAAAARKKIAEQQRKRDEEKAREQEEADKKQRRKTDDLEQKASLAQAEASRMADELRALSKDVYQVGRYLQTVEQVDGALSKILSDIADRKSAKNGALSDTEIQAFENRLKKEYEDKAQSVAEAYETAMSVGMRGAVFNAMNDANKILLEEVKAQNLHKDLTDIAGHVQDIRAKMDELKALNQQAEKADATDRTGMTVLRGQAESVLEAVKAVHEKTQRLIADKNARLKAEEEAKIAAEKRRLFEEAKAKAAAEAAAVAEKIRKEAEERERQRTIVRTDGASRTGGTVKKTEEKAAVLQSLTPQEDGQASDDADKKDDGQKNGGAVIIRRR